MEAIFFASRRCGVTRTRGMQVTNPVFESIFLDSQFGHDLYLLAQRALLDTGANGVAIALHEGDEYVCRATAGDMTPAVGVRLQNDAGITAACIRSAQAVICSNAATDERVNAAACKELGIASIVVVPIKHGENVIGIIEALSERERAFGPAEQALLETLAYEIETWTPSPFAPVNDEVTNAPEVVAALASLFEEENETEAELQDECSDVLSYAEQGTEYQRHRSNFAVVLAPLAVIGVLAAALFMIVGRAETPQASAIEQPHATSITVPASRTDLQVPAPVPPVPSDPAVPSPRATSGLVPSKTGKSSIRELEASARSGDATAQIRLANALAGGAGVAADPVAAEAWYIVAHLAGNNDATEEMQVLSRRLSNSQVASVREKLATMYANGIGVKPDPTTSYFWLTLAEAAGAQGIAARKQRLAREMMHSQIAEANLRAQQWLKQHHQLVAQNWNN